MSKPIHTPGPVEVDVKHDKAGDGRPFADCYISSAANGFHNGRIIADTLNADSAFTEEDRKTNARLLAAAYNAFDSAARKLGCNAVELAERMQDGAIAELLLTTKNLHACIDWSDVPSYEKEMAEVGERACRIIAKVKGDAS